MPPGLLVRFVLLLVDVEMLSSVSCTDLAICILRLSIVVQKHELWLFSVRGKEVLFSTMRPVAGGFQYGSSSVSISCHGDEGIPEMILLSGTVLDFSVPHSRIILSVCDADGGVDDTMMWLPTHTRYSFSRQLHIGSEPALKSCSRRRSHAGNFNRTRNPTVFPAAEGADGSSKRTVNHLDLHCKRNAYGRKHRTVFHSQNFFSRQ